VFCHFNLKRFVFEKLSSNSFKSQRWRAFIITASENSHHWRSLKSTVCGKDHRWRLSNVTRQWWPTAGGCLMWPAGGDSIYIYTRLLTDKRRIPLRTASIRTPHLFTTGFPRFLSIRRARGLQVFDLPSHSSYSNL
jgi:hypothetical protein